MSIKYVTWHASCWHCFASRFFDVGFLLLRSLAVVKLFSFFNMWNKFSIMKFLRGRWKMFLRKEWNFLPRSTSFGFIDYQVNKFSTCWCSIDGKSKILNGLLPSRLIINHSVVWRTVRREIFAKLYKKMNNFQFPKTIRPEVRMLGEKFSFFTMFFLIKLLQNSQLKM